MSPLPMGGKTASEEVTEPQDGTTESDAGSYTIEIVVSGQGIKVGVESAGESAEEGGEVAGDEEQYQACQSIGEACRLVREIYASQGQIQSPSQGQDEMNAGFQ